MSARAWGNERQARRGQRVQPALLAVVAATALWADAATAAAPIAAAAPTSAPTSVAAPTSAGKAPGARPVAANITPFTVPGPGPNAVVLDVRDYGATANDSSNDTAAINRAVTAASATGDGVLRFPSGTFRSCNSIRMKSNVTFHLDAGSVIRGCGGAGYDPPEPNEWDDYQDYGHSHFHNAMIRGDRLTNIGFVGAGMIDGGGALITGNPDSGEADKIISLTRCTNLTLSGITLREGGHFAALINGCTNVVSDRLRIDTAMDRDGWNIISTRNVRITNINADANDDALAFKSDYALGQKLPNGNVTVEDSYLSAGCCNALMFGSETCGDFTGYRFSRITVEGSNKSGLGMVSMDGTRISDVHYRDITMTGVRSPIMMKVGNRRRCGNSPGVGGIDNVSFTNITGRGVTPSFSPTIWGHSASNRVSNVTFDNVDLTVPGGSGTMSTDPPSNDSTNYNPNSIGTRPAFGWYIRYASDLTFRNSEVRFAANDNRPAVLVNNSTRIALDGFVAQRGSGSPFDVGYQSSSGQCASNARNTAGGALRYSPSGAPPTCGPGTPPGTRYEAENAVIAQGTVDSDHAGYSGTGFVNYTNVAGSAVEWTVTAATAGPATLTFRYANGTTVNRPMDVAVNGAVVRPGLAFAGTGAWTNWRTVTTTVDLVAGANTVRATATTANGGPNVDYLEL